MRYLLDANILLRRIEPAHVHHAVALSAVRSLTASGAALCIAPQSVYEFWAVATRLIADRGLGLSIAQADRDTAHIESLFTLLPDGPDVYRQWRRLVAQYGAQGKLAHDARYVAFMLAHGITHILTFNGTDFRRYEASEGIVIVDPTSVSPTSTAPAPTAPPNAKEKSASLFCILHF